MDPAPDSSPDSWICAVCQTTFPHTTPKSFIEDHPVCNPCIRALFSNSIEDEANFPPRWGRTILWPEPYSDILRESFIRVCTARAEEWRIPVDERIYCTHTRSNGGQCGTFLGQSRDRRICRRCDRCLSYTCMCCSRNWRAGHGTGRLIQIVHECDLPSVNEEYQQAREQAFAGLQRGRHYQDCPKCKRRIELIDGCSKYPDPLSIDFALLTLSQTLSFAAAVYPSASSAVKKHPKLQTIGPWEAVHVGTRDRSMSV